MSANRHPVFARMYARMSATAEARGGAEHRRELLAGLEGRVVEVGAGNGLNFAHYPDTVTEVLAIEPEPHLRRLAEQAAKRATVKITVMDGTADQLPLDDESCQAAVCSLVLCSVPDQERALREIQRVLAPGGELRFYEHVVANAPRLARVQRILDRTVWPLVGAGCRCSRDTLAAITAAGFTITTSRRFPFKPFPGAAATAPHVLGVATRP